MITWCALGSFWVYVGVTVFLQCQVLCEWAMELCLNLLKEQGWSFFKNKLLQNLCWRCFNWKIELISRKAVHIWQFSLMYWRLFFFCLMLRCSTQSSPLRHSRPATVRGGVDFMFDLSPINIREEQGLLPWQLPRSVIRSSARKAKSTVFLSCSV